MERDSNESRITNSNRWANLDFSARIARQRDLAYIAQTIINKEASKELRRIKSLQKTHGNYITMPEGKTEADVARHFALYKMVHNINMAGFFTGYASDNKNTTDVFKPLLPYASLISPTWFWAYYLSQSEWGLRRIMSPASFLQANPLITA